MEGGLEGGGGVGGGCVGGGADGPDWEQPLHPPQVHLSSQACVLSSQNGLHALQTSPQAEQPFHEHFTDHGCVLVSQKGLHSDSADSAPHP